MSARLNHPTPERLQDFVEDTLGGARERRVRAHIEGCVRCQAEVEELREVFAALERLPTLEPTAGFADRVMRHVRIPQTAPAREPVLAGALTAAGAWLDRATPDTTRGWA
ncbi:MAG: anti-sigma factor family protein, partial [Gemmatimonadota bacterium]